MRDYNGPGAWSASDVAARYRQLARSYGLREPRAIEACVHRQGDDVWVYPVMDAVLDGIKAGDPACVELGVQFVESDHRQPFGRILHANAARYLRRAHLTPEQQARLRRRILAMLEAAQVPHEYHEYARLLRRIGLGPDWPAVRARASTDNPYVVRWVRYYDLAVEQTRKGA